MQAYYAVWPEEADVLREADLDQLADVVIKLDLEKAYEYRRPLKLQIPAELRAVLDEAAKLGHVRTEVLIAAARQYREKYPLPENWVESAPQVENEEKVGRTSMVLRLLPGARALLQNIGRGRAGIANRHEALIELATIIQNMDLPDRRHHKRVTVYLQIPEKLQDAIELRHKESRVSRVKILLKAAYEQRREEDR